jgi:hypothetical protein
MEENEILRECDTCMEEKKCMQNFGGETLADRQFRRHRHIWQHSIKIALRNRMGGHFLD